MKKDYMNVVEQHNEPFLPTIHDAKAYYRIVKVKDIVVPPEYQRFVRPRIVNHIIGNFKPRALGVLLLSEREDGQLYVMDGLQRRTAVHQMDPNYDMPCMVYTHLPIQIEADTFQEYNRHRAPLLPRELYKARLAAGEPAAIYISETLKTLGLHIQLEPGLLGKGAIESVTTLDRIYQHSPQSVSETLRIILAAWGKLDRKAFLASIVYGVHRFTAMYHSDYKRDHLITALRQNSPQNIQILAYEITNIEGTTRDAFGQAVLKIYNRSLSRKSRLIPWNERREEVKRGDTPGNVVFFERRAQ